MKKFLLSLIVLFIFCGVSLAEEQKPLHLWVPYDSEKPGGLDNLYNKYIFIQDSDLEQIKNSTPPKKTDSGDPPVGYQITSADYFAEITNDIIKIKGVYKINKLDDKWALVPVLFAQTALKSAALGEQPAQITTDKNYHALPLKEKGSYVLTLNFTEKINNTVSQNVKSFTINQTVIPVTNLECRINEQDIAFDIPNAVSIVSENTPEGSKAIVSLLPTGNIFVKWIPKSTLISDIKPDDNMAPSANAVTYSKIEAGRGALKGTFIADLDIRRSPLSHFEFYIPEGIEIDSIEVQDNELTDSYPEIKDNILPVDLVSPVEGRVRLTIYFRKNFDDSSFKTKLPAITFVNENIDRETGFVALVETTNIESSIVEADETKNYREIDSNELEGYLRGLKSSIALKYTKNKDNIKEIPYDITITIVRHKDVAVYEANIEYTNITSILNKDGGMFTKAIIQVKNTGKQFLDITLPENSSVWSVYVNHKSVKPAVKDAEKGIYAIPLVKSTSSPVEVVYFTDKVLSPCWTDMKALTAELMSNSVKWNIYVPKDMGFIPIGALSNLLKDKKTYHIYNRRNIQVMDEVKMEEAEQLAAPQPVMEARKDWKVGKSIAGSYAPVPQMQQVYKSKKVGKLPVYIDLPSIGTSHNFYQLSFEAGKFPTVFAVYLNDFIFDLLKLLIAAVLIYIVFKNDKIRNIWLTPIVRVFTAVKNNISKPPKSLIIIISSIAGGVVLVIAGLIFVPWLVLPLILLGIIILVVTGIVLLIRFLLRKRRTKNDENK